MKLASEILEPNQLREAVGATSVSQYGTGNGSYVLVEMEQVFTGWVTITGMKGKPGGQVTIMASAVPTPVNHDVCHQWMTDPASERKLKSLEHICRLE